jgi:hypothetical protein
MKMVWSDILFFIGLLLGLAGMALVKLPDLFDLIGRTPGDQDSGTRRHLRVHDCQNDLS